MPMYEVTVLKTRSTTIEQIWHVDCETEDQAYENYGAGELTDENFYDGDSSTEVLAAMSFEDIGLAEEDYYGGV